MMLTLTYVGIHDKQRKTQQEIDMGNFKKRPVAMALLGVLATYAQVSAQAQTADADQIVVTANKVSQSALKVARSADQIGTGVQETQVQGGQACASGSQSIGASIPAR